MDLRWITEHPRVLLRWMAQRSASFWIYVAIALVMLAPAWALLFWAACGIVGIWLAIALIAVSVCVGHASMKAMLALMKKAWAWQRRVTAKPVPAPKRQTKAELMAEAEQELEERLRLIEASGMDEDDKIALKNDELDKHEELVREILS